MLVRGHAVSPQSQDDSASTEPSPRVKELLSYLQEQPRTGSSGAEGAALLGGTSASQRPLRGRAAAARGGVTDERAESPVYGYPDRRADSATRARLARAAAGFSPRPLPELHSDRRAMAARRVGQALRVTSQPGATEWQGVGDKRLPASYWASSKTSGSSGGFVSFAKIAPADQRLVWLRV